MIRNFLPAGIPVSITIYQTAKFSIASNCTSRQRFYITKFLHFITKYGFFKFTSCTNPKAIKFTTRLNRREKYNQFYNKNQVEYQRQRLENMLKKYAIKCSSRHLNGSTHFQIFFIKNFFFLL